MMTDLAPALAAAAAVLRAAKTVVATGHVGPDGDALGSMLAVAIAAREAGKTAFATFGEPFVLPNHYRFLDQTQLVPPSTSFESIDVLVACDTASPDRLGSVAALAEQADQVIVIDHHISNGGFGDVAIIDPGAAATAQLVYYLLEELDWTVTPAIADALYAGLVTDTGRFQYSNTSPDVHRLTADLLDAGVRPDVIGQQLFEESPFGYLNVAGAVMARAVLEPERSFVWSVLTNADLEKGGVAYEETEGLIDLIRIAEEADVACLLKELEPGVVKGSLRSRGRVDVAAVAGSFGGGGHHNAAGFTTSGRPEEVIAVIRKRLDS